MPFPSGTLVAHQMQNRRIAKCFSCSLQNFTSWLSEVWWELIHPLLISLLKIREQYFSMISSRIQVTNNSHWLVCLESYDLSAIELLSIKGALDKNNIILQLFPKKVGVFIPKEVLAWIMTAWWLLLSRRTYFWRNVNISSIFYFSKSTSINTQYSSLWDILKMMQFTKYLIKWKRIGRMTWKVWYWFNSKSSIELDIKRWMQGCKQKEKARKAWKSAWIWAKSFQNRLKRNTSAGIWTSWKQEFLQKQENLHACGCYTCTMPLSKGEKKIPGFTSFS